MRYLSSTKKGYRINNTPDFLNEGELLALLGEERMERVICLDEVDSTNDYLKKEAQKGAPDGTIVLSDCQLKGKGRMGRSFQSPKGVGLYISLLMRPDSLPENIVEITAWTAVAVCRAIERSCGFEPEIKWVNDIVSNGKKLCGILTEMAVEGESAHIQYVIPGIGININEVENDFPDELKKTATSIFMETGTRVKRAELAAALIEELDDICRGWPMEKPKYLQYYREKCSTPGNEILVISSGKQESAYAVGIADNFGLSIVDSSGKVSVINSGEVSIRKKENQAL